MKLNDKGHLLMLIGAMDEILEQVVSSHARYQLLDVKNKMEKILEKDINEDLQMLATKEFYRTQKK